MDQVSVKFDLISETGAGESKFFSQLNPEMNPGIRQYQKKIFTDQKNLQFLQKYLNQTFQF